MPYKVYNRLPEVCNGAKSLISVIYYKYYNVYNMMECGARTGANVQPWQYSMPDANEAPVRANVQPWQYSMPDANEAPDGQRKKRAANCLQPVNG